MQVPDSGCLGPCDIRMEATLHDVVLINIPTKCCNTQVSDRIMTKLTGKPVSLPKSTLSSSILNSMDALATGTRYSGEPLRIW